MLAYLPYMEKIIWVIRKKNLLIASVRYRAFLPALGMSRAVENIVVHKHFPENFDNTKAVVISKSFSEKSIKFAYKAHSKKIPVILDLCDNIFIDGYSDGFEDLKIENAFKELLPLAAKIIVTTEVLKQRILEVFPKLLTGEDIVIVPDGIEREETWREIKNYSKKIILKPSLINLKSYTHWIKLNVKNLIKRILNVETGKKKDAVFYEEIQIIKASGQKILLWYGNSGSINGHHGIYDLQNIYNDLNEQKNYTLVILSNNFKVFESFRNEYPEINFLYHTWSMDSMYQLLEVSDLVLVPNRLNTFSECKSPNRSLLALEYDCNVWADMTTALKEFEKYIFTNFNEAFNSIHDKSKIKNFKNSNLYKSLLPSSIGASYLNNIEASQPKEADKVVTFFIQFLQDFLLFEELFKELDSQKIIFKIIVVQSAIDKNPILQSKLLRWFELVVIIPNKLVKEESYPILANSKVLLTASESNLPPHKLARHITVRAKQNKIRTITLQHGFENIGISYSDSRQNIEEITFESDVVASWFNHSDLHPNIPQSTVQKIQPIGIFKKEVVKKGVSNKVISVFENLHWTRFDDQYRDSFVKMISQICSQFKDYTIKLKTHPAGKWTTKNKSFFEKISNLEFIDESTAAETLIDESVAVITTPSTVAIDSLLRSTPTAVLKFNLPIDQYGGADLITNQDDIYHFIENSIRDNGVKEFDIKNTNLVRTNASKHFISQFLN